MGLLKPHFEALESVEFYGFAPLKRHVCEGGMRGRLFQAKGLGTSRVMGAYLSGQVLTRVPGCGRQRSAICPHSQRRMQPFCVRLFVHRFIHWVTGSGISHGKQMLVGPLALAYCQTGGSFPGWSLPVSLEALLFHLRTQRPLCPGAENAPPKGLWSG